MRQICIGLVALALGVLLGVALAAALTACAAPKPKYLPHRPLYESWDQERLKANDHGCPSAVFIAPQGELIQCPPM